MSLNVARSGTKEWEMGIIRYYLSSSSPIKDMPIDIIEYAGKGYGLRFYHDDLSHHPDGRREDFVEWIKGCSEKSSKFIGKPVVAEAVDYA